LDLVSWSLITAPVLPAITTAEAKLFLKVDNSDDDTTIASLVLAATRKAEQYVKQVFITQTWDGWLDGFQTSNRMRDEDFEGFKEGPDLYSRGREERFIELTKAPLQSVTHLKTYDTANNVSTFSASNYFLDTASKPARLILNDSASWPSSLRGLHAVNVRVVAGYGLNPSDIPDGVRNAIKLLTTLYFENRGDEDISLPMHIKALLDPYRILRL
jgi:hypothetical protein